MFSLHSASTTTNRFRQTTMRLFAAGGKGGSRASPSDDLNVDDVDDTNDHQISWVSRPTLTRRQAEYDVCCHVSHEVTGCLIIFIVGNLS